MSESPPAKSRTPSASAKNGERSRGRSLSRRGRGNTDTREIVVREVVREGGGGGSMHLPMLTRTNYTEWAILMRVQVQGACLWEAIDPGVPLGDERQERLALGAILRTVPPEMIPVLAAKDNAKEA